MYSPRFLLLLVAALCVVDAALMQNSHLGRRALIDGLGPTGNDNKDDGTGTATDKPSSPASTPSSQSSTTPPTSSSTSVPTSSSTHTSSSTPTSTSSSTTSAPPTSSSVPSSTQPPTSQQTTQPPTSEPPSSHSTVTSVVTSTSTSEPASSSKPTSTPGLNSDKDGATSGMPAKTRNTVIGVVVGIGGAILLGAIGMVAYRIWGRRKHSEENDGLMSYNMSTNGYEKHEPSNSISSTQRTPFQSTLENYHQPQSNVNASSNF
ncbi:hypothetical protein PWT90_06221 [Aphanocladium album]|nr:hypothetical protein PWT90_06221 [Aphanocladium album]